MLKNMCSLMMSARNIYALLYDSNILGEKKTNLYAYIRIKTLELNHGLLFSDKTFCKVY